MRRLAVLLVAVAALAAAALAGLGAVARRSGRHAPVDVVAAGTRELGVELRSFRVPTNGIALHVVDAGPRKGPPVLLLHGYPEFWWGWRRQIAALAGAGFHVIAPDQRGYADSDKPHGIWAYRMDVLVDDVIGLLDSYQIRQVNLAGHDWGGAVAWHVALAHPERVRRLAIFNAPHPLAWVDARREGIGGGLGWYRAFFRIPWLPETVLRLDDWRPLADGLRDSSRPGTFDDAALEPYRAAWAQDGAMRAMLDWYRAAFRYPPLPAGDGAVTVPVRIVWGMQDRFFPSRMATLSAAHCRDVRLEEVPQAGHWLLHEEPELTSGALVEFFAADRPVTAPAVEAGVEGRVLPASPCATCPHAERPQP